MRLDTGEHGGAAYRHSYTGLVTTAQGSHLYAGAGVPMGVFHNEWRAQVTYV